MPNVKVLQAAAHRRSARAAQAERVYRGYVDQLPELIRQLDSSPKFEHNRAYNLLFQMNILIVPELVAALKDPGLSPAAIDDLVSLLGTTGDQRACGPLWDHFLAVQGWPERATPAARSLACLGDDRVLPYVREQLQGCTPQTPEQAIDLVMALVYIGRLEDVPSLRALHRRYVKHDRLSLKIRRGAASAVLAILAEVGGSASNRVMDQIRTNFADVTLWKDILAARESNLARVF